MRLLVTLMLTEAGVLRLPLLCRSLYLRQHRERSCALLDAVRHVGDREAWLAFFPQGVRETAENATRTMHRISEQFAADRERRVAQGGRVGRALRVLDAFRGRSILTIREAVRSSGLSFSAASAAMRRLEAAGTVRETTGFRRNRWSRSRRHRPRDHRLQAKPRVRPQRVVGALQRGLPEL